MTILTTTTTQANDRYTETLDLSTVPANQLHHIIELGNMVAMLIGNCDLVPAKEGSSADAMATDFMKAMAALWREHAVRQ